MSDHDAGSNEFTHYVPSPEDRVSTLEQVVSTALNCRTSSPAAPAADVHIIETLQTVKDRVSALEQLVSTALTSPVVAPAAPAADHTARLGVIETVLATVSNDMKHILSTRTSTKDSQP